MGGSKRGREQVNRGREVIKGNIFKRRKRRKGSVCVARWKFGGWGECGNNEIYVC